MQAKIAANLGVDPVRVRYFDPGEQDALGVEGARWMLWYDGRWQSMPWHFNGPLDVTRDLVRAKLGIPTVVNLPGE